MIVNPVDEADMGLDLKIGYVYNRPDREPVISEST